MSFLVFQQGFQKPGQGNYSNYDETQKNEMTPLQVQGISLKVELDNRYGTIIPKEKRNKWVNEMMQIDDFRYMNTKFVAAALVIIDQELEYINIAEMPETLKNVVFPNKQIIDKYTDNLVDKSRRKDKDFTESLVKKILFSYIWKIYHSREESIEPGMEEYTEANTEIKIPDVTGNV
jgi:hypothetical protein